MIDSVSRSAYNLPGRTPLERANKPILSEGDRVTLSAAEPGCEGGTMKCGFVEAALALLVTLGGEAALAFAKKIAQETGRALAEVASEMIDQFRNKPREDSAKKELSVHFQGPVRAPRTLAIF